MPPYETVNPSEASKPAIAARGERAGKSHWWIWLVIAGVVALGWWYFRSRGAQANGATMLCIGVELDQLTGPAYLTHWNDIISAVRAVFSARTNRSHNSASASAACIKDKFGLTARKCEPSSQHW